jgi:hypothetical protein
VAARLISSAEEAGEVVERLKTKTVGDLVSRRCGANR